jgi:diguanylate cyclase (GGDEF)-like protein
MFNTVFQRSAQDPLKRRRMARAEQSLLAETLLRASTCLLSSSEPAAAIEHMCESLVAATPHIPAAWAWFGDTQTEIIEPQVLAGFARHEAGPLRIARSAFSQQAVENGLHKKQRSFGFEISAVSRYPLWRELAQRYGIRSAFVTPISNGDDERGLLCFFSTRAEYFESLGNGLFETLGQWSHSVLTQSRQKSELEAEARRDGVTGLHNRRYAQRLIDNAWRAPLEHDNRGVLLLMDVDHFKGINETCGRRVGDLALNHLARVIEQNLRRTDVISRWGGDEFLAWLPAVSGTTALTTAEQLRTSVAGNPPDALQGLHLDLRISIGATPVPASDSFAAAFDRADRALTLAKKNGRDCVVVARPDA